jgi:hypothetical protein
LVFKEKPVAPEDIEPIPQSTAGYQHTADALRHEIYRGLDVLRNAVSSGNEAEGWTMENRAEVQKSLLFGDPVGFSGKFRDSFVRPEESLHFPEKSRAQRQWVHLLALQEYRSSILTAWGAVTADYLESIWLEARRRQDLTPAMLAISTLRDRSHRMWYSSKLASLLSEGHFPELRLKLLPESPLADVYTASLLFGSERFFLPTAIRSPSEYGSQWMAGRCLTEWHLAFLQRPRVAECVADLDDKFGSDLLLQLNQVEQDLLTEAPAGQLAMELDRLRDLTPNLPPHLPPPVYTFISKCDDLIGHEPNPVPLTDYVDVKKVADTVALLGWWRWSALTGNREREVKSASRLNEETVALLPPALHDAYTRWRIPTQSDRAAGSKLATDLATIFTETKDSEVESAARDLLVSWEELDETTPPAMASPLPWQVLARHPGTIALFTAREQSARDTLAQINGFRTPDMASEPLAQCFENALEGAFQPNDATLEKARRILALDAVVAALPGEEHNRYLTHWRILTRPKTSPKEVAEGCRSILRETTSLACSILAARRLKEATSGTP